MCGIWALLGIKPTLLNLPSCLEKLKARGPEGSRVIDLSGATLGFTRLAINGLNEGGMQPFGLRNVSWICNGEIYNWRALQEEHGFSLKSGSDCEVLGALYEKFADNPTSFFRSLDGVFAIVLVDVERNRMLVGRDPYGVRPLFSCCVPNGDDTSATYFFASERKAFQTFPTMVIRPVQPGTYSEFSLNPPALKRTFPYHIPHWVTNPAYSPANPMGLEMAAGALRFALEEAVRKRLMTERPVAALLSGGVDSSLIASLVSRMLREAGKPPLKTFSIGMPGSTDVLYARKVANWIDSDHTEILLSADEFFKAIPQVVYEIESFDTTTVRASVGNWLVAREIARRSDCKVVFNGDGSDELFGSYLYCFKAPNDRAFEEETERLLKDIHYFDVLRSDRCISSHGLEPRTPFLDKQFVAVAKQIATCWRRPTSAHCEKWLLRRAFDDGVTLPHEVLWRRKEAFSDGVSGTEKSWYEEIQERVADLVPEGWKQCCASWSEPKPKTPEQYYYRSLFNTSYGLEMSTNVIPYFWMPRWSPETNDPSARTLGVYSSS